MSFRVPNQCRIRTGPMGSDDSIGNNGAFMINGPIGTFYIIASDGSGWEHVSVHIRRIEQDVTPSWD